MTKCRLKVTKWKSFAYHRKLKVMWTRFILLAQTNWILHKSCRIKSVKIETISLLKEYCNVHIKQMWNWWKSQNQSYRPAKMKKKKLKEPMPLNGYQRWPPCPVRFRIVVWELLTVCMHVCMLHDTYWQCTCMHAHKHTSTQAHMRISTLPHK